MRLKIIIFTVVAFTMMLLFQYQLGIAQEQEVDIVDQPEMTVLPPELNEKNTSFKVHERPITYNYHIPSEAEFDQFVAEEMSTNENKQLEKLIGKEQAKKQVVTKLRNDIEILKEKNKQKEGTIQVVEAGEHSAWFTLYTYEYVAGQCTDIPVDPFNIFIAGYSNQGHVSSTVYRMWQSGWELPTGGGNQCAIVATFDPGRVNPGLMTLQNAQLGYPYYGFFSSRDHARVWGHSLGDPFWGQWSIVATHHENFCLFNCGSWWEWPNHCVDNFDASEGFVINSLWGNKHVGYDWVGVNPGTYLKCYATVTNDGIMPWVWWW